MVMKKTCVIGVLVEKDYKPVSWVASLLGSRLYYDLTDPKEFEVKVNRLMKEVGNRGKAS